MLPSAAAAAGTGWSIGRACCAQCAQQPPARYRSNKLRPDMARTHLQSMHRSSSENLSLERTTVGAITCRGAPGSIARQPMAMKQACTGSYTHDVCISGTVARVKAWVRVCDALPRLRACEHARGFGPRGPSLIKPPPGLHMVAHPGAALMQMFACLNGARSRPGGDRDLQCRLTRAPLSPGHSPMRAIWMRCST